MGNTRTTLELQQLLEAFINDLSERFGKVHEHLVEMNTLLTTIEQARTEVDANTTIANAKLEREVTIKKLEAETKSAMVTVVHAFFKRRTEDLHSLSMPEIMEEVTNNFVHQPASTGYAHGSITSMAPSPIRNDRLHLRNPCAPSCHLHRTAAMALPLQATPQRAANR